MRMALLEALLMILIFKISSFSNAGTRISLSGAKFGPKRRARMLTVRQPSLLNTLRKSATCATNASQFFRSKPTNSSPTPAHRRGLSPAKYSAPYIRSCQSPVLLSAVSTLSNWRCSSFSLYRRAGKATSPL